MTIKDLKNIYLKELSNLYPKQEIDSFFYLITESFLNLNRIDIALDPKLEIIFEVEQKFISALAKLKKEIPVQYILGTTEFYGLNFKVDKNVLIPRPETEELVKWVIEEVKSEKIITNDKFRKQTTNLNILDIGTGSGCIAIALAKSIPNARVWALDVSGKALEIAKYNAKINGVDIQFLHKDILHMKKFTLKFDLIISNPPYVRELEKNEINNNVLKYEPHLALFVKNENALVYYDKIADLAKSNLNKNGQLYFEINQYLGNETKALLHKKGFKNIELRKDIFKNDRMLKTKISSNIT